MKTISVVIETANLELSPALGLPGVIAGLESQTYPRDRLEIIVVVDAENPTLGAYVRERYPAVRLVEKRDSTYYTMKNAGADVATGDIIAMLDSDCIPCPQWAEHIAARIESGADAIGGKTRYAAGRSFARTLNFFNFGYIQSDGRGVANSFLPNNVAFAQEVFLQNRFDARLRRSGAAHFLCQQLKARGYRVGYEPAMRVTHNHYGFGEELHMRIKAGYDIVNLSTVDVERVLQEAPYMRAGSPGLFVVCLNRIVFDFRAALRNRKDLDLSLLDVPYFFAVSPVIRGLELMAGLIAVARPRYFKDKHGW